MRLLFKKILVANRGEIAIRIFRAATELNIRTVGIYTYEDRFSLHRYKADEAYLVGKQGQPIASYLDQERIIQIAKDTECEAIHPGYGFLSENAEFASKCMEAGLVFIGPSPKVLQTFGDKVAAKKAAMAAGLRLIPGSEQAIESAEEALKFANNIGFPVVIKAAAGGGGKGIRLLENAVDFLEKWNLAQSEALKSFGRGDLYIEKAIVKPKHIEVQILGDEFGNIVHLYERDCSIQRRNQKIVEVAPAIGISEESKQSIYEQSLKLARSVQYVGLGTVEFLIDLEGSAYFLEVNPRVQVEHTVTEMVTGVDLVQASILVASGKCLNHAALAIKNQNSIQLKGFAIQCRITTEDPQNDFAPSTGQISAYRAAAGFGIRLDEGLGTTNAVITPYYDSLLVKLTAWGFDQHAATMKMLRSLSEFRIRGVKHNIALLKNIVSHPRFVDSSMTTAFLPENPEVFSFPKPKDRATKYLRYLADVTINNTHQLPPHAGTTFTEPSIPNDKDFFQDPAQGKKSAKMIFQEGGAKALVSWIHQQKELLITDTSMRDAHQSLFATRLRSRDIYRIAPAYAKFAQGLFSLEMWGGATFDTCLRFLMEDPWERLATLREQVPNSLLQMLFRGNNAVGYTNYPRWVITEFIRKSVDNGLDIFRIFDCLNNVEQMQAAIEDTKAFGGLAEACICYTGDLASSRETKYTLNYYLSLAKELEKRGSDILCIKDMAGLLKPASARLLIKALKEHVAMPIHLHTHDTSGNGVAMLLAASEAGCDIVDTAISSMSGLTSQPSMNAVCASLEGSGRAPLLNLRNLDELSNYWAGVRQMYQAFDPGLVATTTRVYEHEIPGGQYSNLVEQARKVGLKPKEFEELTERYKEVNDLLGNIVKVTPSSKVVGDFALLLQKNRLTGPELLEKKPRLDYPDSVITFFKGHIGVPYGGFPEDMRALVLGPNPPAPHFEPVDKEDSMDIAKNLLEKSLARPVTDEEVLSHRLYPKVFMEFNQRQETYGRVDSLATPDFFYGIHAGQEISVDVEPGKTLYISLNGISEPDKQGFRTVFFNLNGFSRDIRVLDQKLAKSKDQRPKAASGNPNHVASPMPGKVLAIRVKPGDKVMANQVLLVTESMKMEYTVMAKQDGVVGAIHVKAGDMIEDQDLLLEMQN